MKLKFVTIFCALLFFVNIGVSSEIVNLPYEYEKHYTRLYDIAESKDGVIVAVGLNGAMYTHTNDKWVESECSLFDNLYNIEYGNGYFYASGDLGIYASSNGMGWTKVSNECCKKDGIFIFNGNQFVIELIDNGTDKNGMLYEKNLGIFQTNDFVNFTKLFDGYNSQLTATIDSYNYIDFFQPEKNNACIDEVFDVLFEDKMNSCKIINRKIKTIQQLTGIDFPVSADDVKYLGRCTEGYEIFYISDYNLIRATTNDFINWNSMVLELPNKSEYLYYANILYNDGYYIQYHTSERYEYSYTTNIVFSDDLNNFHVLSNIREENGDMYVFDGYVYLLSNDQIYKINDAEATKVLHTETQKRRTTIKYSNGKYIKWEYDDEVKVYLSDDGYNWRLVEKPDFTLTYLCDVEGIAYYDMIWDGKNYVIRPTNCDNGYNPAGEEGVLRIYDTSLELINEIPFSNYILDMSYEGNKYNVLTNIDSLLYSSNDLYFWECEKNNLELPLTNDKTTIIKQLKKAEKGFNISEQQTKINMKGTFEDIIFENHIEGDITVSGKYYIKTGKDIISISDDGVYWNTIQLPSGVTTPQNVYIDNNILYVMNHNVTLKYNIDNVNNGLRTYVKAEGKVLAFDVEPVVEDERTLVPLRFIFETLGADVEWENSTQTAVVQNEDNTIVFSIDNTTANVNNVEKKMDVPARLVNNKTMVPLRFLSEELGFNVEWDNGTRTAVIGK